MFGPTVIGPPFLARSDPSHGATAAGSVSLHAGFSLAGDDAQHATLGTGIAVPGGETLVLGVFDMSISGSTAVGAHPIFSPTYAHANLDVTVSIFRSRAGGSFVLNQTTTILEHWTILGSQLDETRLVRRMALARLNPPAEHGEALQFLISFTARAGGGGVVAEGSAGLLGHLNTITLVGG